MKTKKIFNCIAVIMIIMSSGICSFSQTISGPGRLWQGGFPPITPSTSFSNNRDVWQDTIGVKSYVWTGSKWRESPTQLGKGTNGTNGRDGVDGVCPSCPPSGTGNVGNVRWVTNWTDLKTALIDNNIRAIYLASNITQTEKLRIPTNYSAIKKIVGNGFDWNIPSAIDTGMTRNYASLTEANQGIDMQLRISDVIFKGGNNVGIYLEANYGAKFEGCRFYNFKTALDLRWCMGTIVDQCYFWENYIGINFDYARFINGSNSASQSNHSIVTNCKFRSSPNHFAPIKVIAVSGMVIYHNIFEGGDVNHNGSDYEVFFDDNGSAVVKEVHIYGNHVEQKPKISAFNVRLKDGNAYVGGIYSQYDCNLIRFEGAGYAKMIVENIPYLTGGTKFENVSSAGRWKFINVPATFSISDLTKWISTPPINSAIDGWQTNGQSNYLQGTTIK
jgi:hypothetical protein